MSRIEEELNKLLGVQNLPDVVEEENLSGEDYEETLRPSPYDMVPVYDPVDTSIDDDGSDAVQDYIKSRNVLYGLIERAQRTLECSIHLAKDSEHPRAIEVTTNLIKEISNLSKDLLDLHTKFIASRAVTKANEVSTVPTTVNNNTLVINGDTSLKDLLNSLNDEIGGYSCNKCGDYVPSDESHYC